MELPHIPEATHLLKIPYWHRRLIFKSGEFGLPRIVYKYASFNPHIEESMDRARSIIIRSKLWYSRPSEFNDPFDFRAKLRDVANPELFRKKYISLLKKSELGISKREMERAASDALLKLKTNPSLTQEAFERLRNESGVTCFTPNPRNALMWAHYANSHTGICFAFRPDHDPGVLGILQKVRYVNELPQFSWPEESTHLLQKVLLAKSAEWSYEDEYRLIGTIDDNGQAHGFNPSALQAIIVGVRFSAKSLESLKLILKERIDLGLPPTRLLQARTGLSDYRIRISAINHDILKVAG